MQSSHLLQHRLKPWSRRRGPYPRCQHLSDRPVGFVFFLSRCKLLTIGAKQVCRLFLKVLECHLAIVNLGQCFVNRNKPAFQESLRDFALPGVEEISGGFGKHLHHGASLFVRDTRVAKGSAALEGSY